MKGVHPYLNFPGNAEEAMEFYRSVFGGEFATLMRFRDFNGEEMGVADDELDRIAHIGLPLNEDTFLMASDTTSSSPKTPSTGNNVYITLEPDDADEARRLFEGLSAGGEVEMPLQRTVWAELYGSFVDRFGIQWMVNYEGEVSFG